MQSRLNFLPISYVERGERVAGLFHGWTDKCKRCDRQCEKLPRGRLSTCSYGVNFYGLTKDLTLFGFLAQVSNNHPGHSKAMRQNPECILRKTSLDQIVSRFREVTAKKEADEAEIKQQFIDKYKSERMYERDLLELLKPEIKKSLAFLHDYKQFVSRVKQNINVIIETRYKSLTLDQKLAEATKQEAAIYWLSSMMSEKLSTAFLLLNPERLEWEERSTFRLHGLVLKYIRIYDADFQEKGVTLIQNGRSEGSITANSAAFSVIPHTLIDNALKYSMRNSRVIIDFRESPQNIEMSVTSWGPKIESDESKSIFEIFYRGRSAKIQEEEGVGFGLYLAQYVARDLGTEIRVLQKNSPASHGYETTFSILLRRTE